LGTSKETGWACSGISQSGGCRSGITGFEQTTGMDRFQCLQCDYDLCELCLCREVRDVIPEARDVILKERGAPKASHYEVSLVGEWYYDVGNGSQSYLIVDESGRLFFEEGQDEEKRRGELVRQEGQHQEWWIAPLTEPNGTTWGEIRLRVHDGRADQIQSNFHWTGKSWGKDLIATKAKVAELDRVLPLPPGMVLQPATSPQTVSQSAPAMYIGGVGPPDGAWSLESHGAPGSLQFAPPGRSLSDEIKAVLDARECIHQDLLLKDASLAELKKKIGQEHQPPPIPVSMPLQDFLDTRPVWHEDCTEKSGLGDTENMSRVSPAESDANDMSIEPVDDDESV